MTISLGLELASGDPTPLVLRGGRSISRGAVKAASDTLLEVLTAERVSRAMVRSDDPFHILGAIDACSRAGADLFIAHTTLPSRSG